MKDKELLEKIWEKVQYLNHCTTKNTNDIAWIKWLLMLVSGILILGFIKVIFQGYL